MRDVIEKFLKASTSEVLDRFYNFGGARTVVGRDFLFIPGERDPHERILLVGHADTVFTSPPQTIEWNGNMCRAGAGSGRKQSESHLPSRFGTKQSEPPEPPKQASYVQKGEDAKPERVDVSQVLSPEAKVVAPPSSGISVDKGGKVITYNGKDYTLTEWEEERKKGTLPGLSSQPKTLPPPQTGYNRPPYGSGGYPTQHGYGGGAYNRNDSYSRGGDSRSRGGWKSGGLGADDRVGDAMIWLLRRTGHSILITDCEEMGGIGAKEAARTIPQLISEHQFAIEIDRMGDQDMAFYDVSTPDFEWWMLRQTGSAWQRSHGSYTDIKDVCRAGGICGVNMAAGYFEQHTSSEKFVYDFWLRTFKIVHKITQMRELPRFELPRPQPAKTPDPTPAVAAAPLPVNISKKKKEKANRKGKSTGGGSTTTAPSSTASASPSAKQPSGSSSPKGPKTRLYEGPDEKEDKEPGFSRYRDQRLVTASGKTIRPTDLAHIADATVDLLPAMTTKSVN